MNIDLRHQRIHNGEYETLRDMAIKLNLSVVYLSDIERGQRAFPVKRFNDFMKAYGFNKEQSQMIANKLINESEYKTGGVIDMVGMK